MKKLPGQLKFQVGELTFQVVHGSFEQTNEFVFHSTKKKRKADQLQKAKVDGIIAGHCGIPFAEKIEASGFWLNPGVIGLPPNDGTQLGWYATLEKRDRQVYFSSHHFRYDLSETLKAMAGRLPEEYITSLKTGIWPSQDILPPQEKKQQGVPIPPFFTPLNREVPQFVKTSLL